MRYFHNPHIRLCSFEGVRYDEKGVYLSTSALLFMCPMMVNGRCHELFFGDCLKFKRGDVCFGLMETPSDDISLHLAAIKRDLPLFDIGAAEYINELIRERRVSRTLICQCLGYSRTRDLDNLFKAHSFDIASTVPGRLPGTGSPELRERIVDRVQLYNGFLVPTEDVMAVRNECDYLRRVNAEAQATNLGLNAILDVQRGRE
jgi:hypothetical protein